MLKLKNAVTVLLCLAVLCLASSKDTVFSPSKWNNMLGKDLQGERCLVPVGHARAAVRLDVKAGRWHELSFDVFGDSKVPGLLLSFDCYVREQGRIIVEDGFAVNARSGEWVTHRLLFQSETANPEFVIYSRHEAPDGLPLYFRNFKCEKAKAPEQPPIVVTLTYPEFRDTIYTSVPQEDISGTVVIAKKGARTRVTLTKAGETEELSSAEAADGMFVLPGTKDLPTGKYTLTFASGKTVLTRGIQKLAPSTSEACRYKGRLYHNGRPIVFSGPFKQYQSEAMVYGHARSGMQVFFSDSGKPEDILKKLDIAQKFGCRIILWLRTDSPAYRKNPAEATSVWKAKVDKMLLPEIMTHPALLAYAGQDEPGMGLDPKEEMTLVMDYIREKDPYHPLWINDAPAVSGERARKLSEAADIYGIDIYPCPKGILHAEIMEEKYLPSVGLYADLYGDIMKDKGLVWMCLQGFAWRALFEGRDAVEYPTLLENRHMAFESFAAGSQGNIYWGMHYTSAKGFNHGVSRPFFDDMLAVCKEAAELEAVWINGAPVREGLPNGLRKFVGTADGATYTIVVNDTENELDCGIAVDGLYVLPGGAKAESAMLPPYGVRVYSTVPKYPAKINPFPAQNEALDAQFKVELEEFLGFPEPVK